MLTFICMNLLLQVGSVCAAAELPSKQEQLSAIFQEWNELLDTRPTEEEVKLFEADLLARINKLELPMNIDSIETTNLLLSHYRLTKETYVAQLEEMRRPLRALFAEWNDFLTTDPTRVELVAEYAIIFGKLTPFRDSENRDIRQAASLVLAHVNLTKDAHLTMLMHLEAREPWRKLGFRTFVDLHNYVHEQAKIAKLSRATKDHHVEDGIEVHSSSGPTFAHAGDQHGRIRMEDDHVEAVLPDGSALFGVFDGHRGAQAANFAADRLPFYFYILMQCKAGQKLAFELSMMLLDADLAVASRSIATSGTTVVAAFVCLAARNIWVANVGDSRAALYSHDGNLRAATYDHTPQAEETRLSELGACIIQDGARQGWLSYHGMSFPMSRALGDFHIVSGGSGASELKNVLISHPNVYAWNVALGDFLVLACDGLWDVMTGEQVGAFVHERLESTSLPEIAQQLVAKAKTLPRLADGKKNIDNISVTLVRN